MKFKDRDILLAIEEVEEALKEYSIEASREEIEKFVRSYGYNTILEALNYRQISEAFEEFVNC